MVKSTAPACHNMHGCDVTEGTNKQTYFPNYNIIALDYYVLIKIIMITLTYNFTF